MKGVTFMRRHFFSGLRMSIALTLSVAMVFTGIPGIESFSFKEPGDAVAAELDKVNYDSFSGSSATDSDSDGDIIKLSNQTKVISAKNANDDLDEELIIDDEDIDIPFLGDGNTAFTVQDGNVLSGGSSLANNNIYKFTSTVTKNATANGGSGLYVNANSKVALYIAKGVTVTVNGGAGGTGQGGGAGIYVPSTSTLIITGEGTLVANGGKGGAAGDGGNGGNAYMNWRANEYRGGQGGTGGNGGGGGGAGIGTSGAGGASAITGPTQQTYASNFDNDHSGVTGYTGNTGGTSAGSGTVYILGTVTVKASAGGASSYGYASNSRGSNANDKGSGWHNDYSSGAGGPGGGGGAGSPGLTIGAGGYGGGSGGTGGTGGVYSKHDGNRYPVGGGGAGGKGYSNGTSSTLSAGAEGASGWAVGGAGGSGGSKGSYGSSGYVYKSTTATLNASGVTTKNATTHSAITWNMSFDSNKDYPSNSTTGTIDNINGNVSYCYGVTQITANTKVNVPTRTGYTFKGYYSEQPTGNVGSHTSKDSVQMFDEKGYASVTHLKSNGYIDNDGRWLYPTNLKLYAAWEPNIYVANLKANGGVGSTTKEVVYDAKPSTIESAATKFTRTGYNFKGFNYSTTETQYFNEEGTAQIAKWLHPEDGVNLLAQWSPKHYNIHFYSHDDIFAVDNSSGYVASANDVEYGKLTLPTAEDLGLEREHYDFLGWNIYDEQDWAMYEANVQYKTGLIDVEGGTANIYAAWKIKDNYVITYYPNGGNNGPINGNVFKDESYTVAPASEIPVREGYQFVKWSTTPNGAGGADYAPGAVIPADQIDGNITLYAIWEKNNTVAFNANGGTFNSQLEVKYPAKGATVDLSNELEDKNIPTNIGNTFLGWSENASATEAEYKKGAAESFTMPDKSVILYAIWKLDNFEIDYSVEDKFKYVEKPVNVDYGKSYTFKIKIDTFKTDARNLQVTANGAFLQPKDTKTTDERYVTYTYTVNKATVEQFIYISGLADKLYPVQLRLNGGTNSKDMNEYTYPESTISLPTNEEISKTGYLFAGWYDNAEFEGAAIAAIPVGSHDKLTYFAKWEPVKYTISFDLNGGEGTAPGSINAEYDKEVSLPDATFTHPYGTFSGWTTDSNNSDAEYQKGEAVSNLTTVNSTEVKLYAAWNKPKLSVTYDYNGGRSSTDYPADAYIQKGDEYEISGNDVLSKEGYTFGGWSDGKATPTIYAKENKQTIDHLLEDLSLKAVWEPVTSTITYTFYCDPGYKIIDKDNNSVITGYYSADGAHQADASNGKYYVEKSKNIYTIRESVTYGDDINILNVPFKYVADGSTNIAKYFIGWETVSGNGTIKYTQGQQLTGNTIKENISLYAAVSENDQYYVSFDLDGGKGYVSPVIINGGKAIAPAGNTYTKDHYTFGGWYYSTDTTKGASPINGGEELSGLTGNITLVAKWIPDTYYVVFNPNTTDTGLTGTMGKQTFIYGQSQTLTPNGFVLPGYIFKGWAPLADAIKAVYEDKQQVTNLAYSETENELRSSLYACWEMKNPLTVTFIANGGTNIPEKMEAPSDSLVEIDTNYIPEKEGYTFKGWAIDNETEATYEATISEGSISYSNVPFELNSSKTLCAVWEAKPFCSVEYVAADGAEGIVPEDTSRYYLGDTIEVLFTNVPEKLGYSFEGWTVNGNENAVYTTENYSFAVTEDMLAANGGKIIIAEKLTKNKYSLKFYNGDNLIEGTDSNEIYYGDEYTIPDDKKLTDTDTHIFKGWSRVNGGEVENETGTFKNVSAENGAEISYYAVWAPKEYEFSFDDENGTTNTAKVSILYGANLPSVAGVVSIPTKVGHDFIGYYDGTDNNAKLYYDENLNPSEKMVWEGKADITLHAKWKKKSYNVIFMQDGEVLSQRLVYFGDKVTMPVQNACIPETVLPGVGKLSGWSKNGEKSDDVTLYKPSESVDLWEICEGNDYILYAVIVKDAKYQVTYNGNGGVGIPVDTKTDYEDGDKAEIKYTDSLKRTDYEFVGWSENPNVDPEDSANIYVKGDGKKLSIRDNVTLYAVWKLGQYKINYIDNSKPAGQNIEKTNIVYKGNPEETQYHEGHIVTRPGYTLMGWSTSNSLSNTVTYELGEEITGTLSPKSEFNLYTVWAPKEVQVNFDCMDQGVESLDPLSLTFNSFYGTLPIPERDGFTFVGWFDSYDSNEGTYGNRVTAATRITNPANEHTLYAKWSQDLYKVIYHYNYADNKGTLSDSVNVINNYDLRNESFGRENVELLGYATYSTGEVTYPAGQNVGKNWLSKNATMNLYCVWSYEVSFDTKGADPLESIFVRKGNRYGLLPEPERMGYSFGGWYKTCKNVDGVDEYSEPVTSTSTVNVDKSHTLYAKWIKDGYTVNYHSNNDENITMMVEYDLSEEVSLPSEEELVKQGFSKRGYSLSGFALSAKGYKVYELNQKMTSSWATKNDVIDLYCYYEANDYDVSFDTLGNGKLDSMMVTFDSEYGTLPELSKPGYTFAGWYLSYNKETGEYSGKVEADSIVDVPCDHTLYARFNAYYVVKQKHVVIQEAAREKIDGKSYKIICSDKKIAKMNKNGAITFKRPGHVKFTVKKVSGEQVYEFDVFKPTVDKKIEMQVGGTADVNLENADGFNATYVSLKPGVVKVDEEGNLTAIAKGKATIITTINGVKYKTKVKVK